MNHKRSRSFLALLIATSIQAGRYEDLTRQASIGPHLSLHAATFFGSAGDEGFTGVAVLKDQRILAAGNASGPSFPEGPVRVIGQDQHRGQVDAVAAEGNRSELKPYTPSMAGFVVTYSRDLRRIDHILRFGWGVATIHTLHRTEDGLGIILTGYCDATRLRAALPNVPWQQHDVPPPPASPRNARRKPPPPPPASVYLMRVDKGANDVRWVQVLNGLPKPPDELWMDRLGSVSFASSGLWQVSPDGHTLTRRTTSGGGIEATAGYRGIDPDTGGWYFGGDRNTHTGREPWRQPFLYRFNAEGEKERTLWEWNPKALRDGSGSDEGMVSDSSVRLIRFAPNGDLLVVGWSDGGNSIFSRQPTDSYKSAGPANGPFSTWGMKGANSLAYLLRIDRRNWEQTAWATFMAYVPQTFASARDRGAPNAVSISDVVLPGDNTVALIGRAATGLISTPNAFYQHGDSPRKYGGHCVAVLSPDFSKLRFSSYLPGYTFTRIAALEDGVVVVGTTRRDDGRTDQPPTAPPVKNALQPTFGGGGLDGHLLLLRP